MAYTIGTVTACGTLQVWVNERETRTACRCDMAAPKGYAALSDAATPGEESAFVIVTRCLVLRSPPAAWMLR